MERRSMMKRGTRKAARKHGQRGEFEAAPWKTRPPGEGNPTLTPPSPARVVTGWRVRPTEATSRTSYRSGWQDHCELAEEERGGKSERRHDGRRTD